MGRVLFEIDPTPDPLEQAFTPSPEIIEEEPGVAPITGGRNLFTLEPETQEPTILETVGRGLRGEAELALTVGTGVILEPLAGIAGLVASTPFFKEGAAPATVAFVRDLAFKPGPAGQEIGKGIGQIAEELTPDIILELGTTVKEGFEEQQEEIFQKYGPAAATAFGLVPSLVLEGTAGYFTVKQMRRIATTRADEAIQKTEDAIRDKGTESFRTDIQPEDKTLRQIADDFGTQNERNLIDQIQADPQRVQSARNLGVDLNPSHYSTNQAFIQMEQGLKSKPSSDLGRLEIQAIEKLGEEADKLIVDMGGSIDKGIFNQSVKNKFETTLSKLDARAEKAYAKVNETIPRSTKIVPETSRLYIEGRLEDLGPDIQLLRKSEKDVARILGLPRKERVSPDVEEVDLPTPTYAALDQVRRDVGEAIGKKTGPYKDDEGRILDQVYGALNNDQQGVADAFGVGADLEKGRKIVKMTKEIQQRSVTLFGPKLEASILPKLATAAKNLTKADEANFNRIMKAIPASQRQAAAATMLNSLFTNNLRTAGPLGSGFVGAFESLNRAPSIKKAIFNELPKEALKIFDDIGRVSTGLFKAKALQNNSGTANALLAALDNTSIVNRVLGAKRLLSPFSAKGRAIRFTAAVLKTVIPPKTKRASDLLTSPAFRKSLEDAALGKSVQAEKIINTKTFKNWFKDQTFPDQKQIAAIGFVPWLLSEEEGDPRLNVELSLAEEEP